MAIFAGLFTFVPKAHVTFNQPSQLDSRGAFPLGRQTMRAFHFARAFKAETGKSPLQHVISARMEAAQVLLNTTQVSISEIARRMGYANLLRFGRHFKARVGTKPKAFRDG